jgi:hypothetical protein
MNKDKEKNLRDKVHPKLKVEYHENIQLEAILKKNENQICFLLMYFFLQFEDY